MLSLLIEYKIKIVLSLGGCKVDNQNKLGATPLMTAAGLGRKDIAQLLLQAGADINHVSSISVK